MTDHPVTLINLLRVEPANQPALLALLRENVETVVSTLDGWKTTRLLAGADGASVVIYSEWNTPAAVEAMRADPRMQVYFPRIQELASIDSSIGRAVLNASR